jgi:hypothetical protein
VYCSIHMCSFSCYRCLILFDYSLIRHQTLFQFSYICLDWICGLKCDALWRKFHEMLGTMCILQLLNGMFLNVQ